MVSLVAVLLFVVARVGRREASQALKTHVAAQEIVEAEDDGGREDDEVQHDGDSGGLFARDAEKDQPGGGRGMKRSGCAARRRHE